HLAGGQHPRRAVRHRLRGEIVAVHPLAGQRHEQAAVGHLARIELHAAGDEFVPGGVVKPATGDLRDGGQGQRDHCTTPRNAAVSSSRSENGWISPAISCPVSWPLPPTNTTSPGRASDT